HYFATMKIPLIRGRVWSDSENAGTPHVAVVNQTMARELWPDESAIGRRVRMPEYIKSTSYFRLPAGARQRRLVRDHRCCRRPPQCRSPRAAGAVDLRAVHAHVERFSECDPADELRSTFDDPIDSGGGAYRRYQSHGGRRRVRSRV